MSEHPQPGGHIYTCPMHPDVQQAAPGKCPYCYMALLPEGARFGLARHIFSNPLHLVVMGGVMVVLMIAAMLWR
jgi:Cu+-exporting ATPase